MQTFKMIIYSKDNCPQCVQAKALLDQYSIPYREIKISYGGASNFSGKYISREDFMEQYPEVRAMPYIVHDNGDVLGGLQHLRGYVNLLKGIQ